MIEKILGIAFLISVVTKEIFGINFDQLVFISGSCLAFTYLFANWWISKPKESNVRTIALTLLYGFSSCSLILCLIFQLLFYPGSELLSILCIFFLLVVLGIDFISSLRSHMVLKGSTVWRLAILTTLVIIFYVVPMDDRIQFTFRDHPDFLEYYGISKGTMDFVDLKDDYFRKHQSRNNSKGTSTLQNEYLALGPSYSSQEVFNDSICQIAIDSAIRRFNRSKFELYAFLPSDSSHTPVHLLQNTFRLKVVGFANEDIVFKFCFNKEMIKSFESQYGFNPIDSVKVMYDSLNKIGLTNIQAKFGDNDEDFKKYMICQLEFPDGTNIAAPYPRVRVSFRISPTGSPDEVIIMKSHSEKYDNAVLKLVKMMPKWRPGRGDDGEYQANHIQWEFEFDPIERDKYCR